MKAIPHEHALRDALHEIVGELDSLKGGAAISARRIREIARRAIEATSTPDPLMAAAVALAKSVEVLEGELRAAREALDAGQMWICIDTPRRLDEARTAIAAARAAGVSL